MDKRASWVRQSRAPESSLAGYVGSEGRKPVSTFWDLGYELVTDVPIYDNGMFFVVDTVVGLEWVVVEWATMKQLRKVALNLDEACVLADEFKKAKEPPS